MHLTDRLVSVLDGAENRSPLPLFFLYGMEPLAPRLGFVGEKCRMEQVKHVTIVMKALGSIKLGFASMSIKRATTQHYRTNDPFVTELPLECSYVKHVFGDQLPSAINEHF
jgi:hypothetical protein